MRSIEEVRTVLGLVEEGLNDCEISRRTGIPRPTIMDWRRGLIPRQAREGARAGCPRCGHPEHDFASLPGTEYAYLLGLYLGDGCISAAPRQVWRLRIALDAKYPGIVQECAAATSAVLPGSRVGIYRRRDQNSFEVGSCSRSWPCLFPQHAPGKKHLRKIELSGWQAQIAERNPKPLLRGLIHSDGCHSVNTIRHPKKTYVYPRYLFSNKSDDIRRIFCDACDRLGIAWRVMTRYEISIAHRESIALMDEFIGPKT